MNRKELKNCLLNQLSPLLKSRGFLLNKTHAEFTRKTIDGWHKFQLIFLERAFGWEINLGLLIRKELVESIFHKYSYYDPKFHKSTPTVGVSLENLINDGKEHRFYITNDEEVEDCATEIIKLFDNVALRFFTHFDSIKNLDENVNNIQGKSIFSGPKFEGNTGIILAKIAKNPNYKYLEERYRDYYRHFSDGFYLAEYEGIIKALNEIFHP